MGAKNSTLKPKDLGELAQQSKLTPEEIKKWSRTFKRDHPAGYLTKEEFTEMYSNIYPMGDAKEFCHNMFRVFDLNNDNRIDFREFIIALSVYSKGTFLEKANWIFQLYDQDGNGSISKDEMLTIISSIHRMATKESGEEGGESPESRVEKIYQKMDLNSDGQLSLGEFIELAKADNMVLNVLSSDMTK